LVRSAPAVNRSPVGSAPWPDSTRRPPLLLRSVRGWGQYTGWGRLLAADRLAVAGFSAGVPLAAAALPGAGAALRCAALCYGPLDNLEPGPGLPPLLVVRAGQDRPKLNRSIDRFLTAAAAGGAPVELVDLPAAHHAFDSSTTPTPPATPSPGSWGSSAATWRRDRHRAPVGWPLEGHDWEGL
jgi:dienelactone hydrolase